MFCSSEAFTTCWMRLSIVRYTVSPSCGAFVIVSPATEPMLVVSTTFSPASPRSVDSKALSTPLMPMLSSKA